MEYLYDIDDADESNVGSETEPEPVTDDARSKSIQLLEFDLIRERVADFASFYPARLLVLGQGSSYIQREVADLQQETVEGRALLDERGDVSLRVSSDVTPAIKRASLGGILSGTELLEVSESLEVHRRARNAVLSVRNKAPILAETAQGIPDLEELRRQIRSRIGDNGAVQDDATHTLRALRHQIRQAYDRVAGALSTIIQSSVGEEALQDNVISVRGDRLVVQVKSEMRNRIPGIIHDASNTGATIFVEPFSTVELGNTWRELALEQEREITRILRDLTSLVGRLSDDILRGNDLTAKLDFILARARYSQAIGGVCAMPILPSPPGDGESRGKSRIRLIQARHPLLGSDGVPINVNIGPDWTVLVVTGPNTGGKTVAMKTVGLLAMMHQSGLQIPAEEGSSLPVFDGIFADVGDQQSIEQSVSTFSSHMRNVVEILREATPNSLVLLDELGTSTDPEEGSALAKAILQDFAEREITTIATTHHRSVASFAEATPGMMNASVQLDAGTLRPTYHLTTGVPGRSYAMSVAASLGLPQELMEQARSLMEPQYLRFEDWLNELQGEREQLQQRLQQADETQAHLETLRSQLAEQIDYIVSHRDDILDSVRRELLSQYEETRSRLRRAEAALSWSTAPQQPSRFRQDVARFRKEVEEGRPRTPTPAPLRVRERPLAVGDNVFIRGLNLKGTLVSLPQQQGDAEVSIGSVKIQVDPRRLSLVDGHAEPVKTGVSVDLGPMLESAELDLRGQRVEESLIKLEELLDKAVRDGLSTLRVIHGRGTGALRNAVREHLRGHPLVGSFGPESPEHGGDGATSVHLK